MTLKVMQIIKMTLQSSIAKNCHYSFYTPYYYYYLFFILSCIVFNKIILKVICFCYVNILYSTMTINNANNSDVIISFDGPL